MTKAHTKRDNKVRCTWCGSDPVYVRYHDREWGVPVHQDRRWFEFLVLEGAQAGLSWITILKKRPAYRLAFDNFDFNKVANYKEHKIQALLENEGIVRNRLKIRGAVLNARAFIEVRREFGTFNKFIWSFIGGKPIRNHWKSTKQIPVRTKISDALSRELKQRGFTFVGSTICYAHMQATGMVNDHTVDCFRFFEL
jgi:DNA-3-methyladenine glycosylase I